MERERFIKRYKRATGKILLTTIRANFGFICAYFPQNWTFLAFPRKSFLNSQLHLEGIIWGFVVNLRVIVASSSTILLWLHIILKIVLKSKALSKQSFFLNSHRHTKHTTLQTSHFQPIKTKNQVILKKKVETFNWKFCKRPIPTGN